MPKFEAETALGAMQDSGQENHTPLVYDEVPSGLGCDKEARHRKSRSGPLCPELSIQFPSVPGSRSESERG